MRSQVPFKALLQTKPELGSYLSDPMDDSPVTFDLSQGVIPFTERLKEIHPSWIQATLEPLSKDDQSLFISSLNKETDLTPTARQFIKETLAKKVFGDVTPVEYLPEHPLLHLVSLRKNQLVQLIDYLGLRDLARELSQVIRADIIKTLESMLSREKLIFVKQVMQDGEPIRFAPLQLENWDGNVEKFQQMLHVRGLNRLAKALYGCDPALLWHIMRRLDTGRARILEKHCTDTKNRQAHQVLLTQVQELLQVAL